ncbi:hypothetical protein evm_008699 [Chilo suppressalis]|nr:hypothetical protein evm_008699 [Chilo suppressalis]
MGGCHKTTEQWRELSQEISSEDNISAAVLEIKPEQAPQLNDPSEKTSVSTAAALTQHSKSVSISVQRKKLKQHTRVRHPRVRRHMIHRCIQCSFLFEHIRSQKMLLRRDIERNGHLLEIAQQLRRLTDALQELCRLISQRLDGNTQ